VIVFAGSFNPSHLGHLELAYHTFLRSCPNTIALMFLPVGDNLHAKDGAKVNGKDWVLSKAQRARLLQDDLVKRWSWCFMYDQTDVYELQRTMIQGAKKNGFELSFTVLSGSDHYDATVARGSMEGVAVNVCSCQRVNAQGSESKV
jgi:nicotinic acid mononucleotide adenylyltransferase